MLRATVSLVFTYLSANQFCFPFLYFHHRPLVSNFSSRAFIRASTLAQLASMAATFAVKLDSSWNKNKGKNVLTEHSNKTVYKRTASSHNTRNNSRINAFLWQYPVNRPSFWGSDDCNGYNNVQLYSSHLVGDDARLYLHTGWRARQAKPPENAYAARAWLFARGVAG